MECRKSVKLFSEITEEMQASVIGGASGVQSSLIDGVGTVVFFDSQSSPNVFYAVRFGRNGQKPEEAEGKIEGMEGQAIFNAVKNIRFTPIAN